MKGKDLTGFQKPVRSVLPPGYEHQETLDLAENPRMATRLNLVAAAVFFLFGGLVAGFSAAVRADTLLAFLKALLWLEAAGIPATVGVLIGLQLGMVVLHELVHGALFWIFTRERPVFGLKLPFAAYAAAPDWYLARNQHLAVGLGPFAVITVAGLALVTVVPASLLPAVLFIVASNGAGAVGDFTMMARLLEQPPDALVRDTGSAIEIYVRAKT